MWPFEIELGVGPFRKRWLRLAEDLITFGDESIEVALINEVRADKFVLRNRGIPIAHRFTIDLVGRGGHQLGIAWWQSALASSRRKRSNIEIFLTVLEFLYQTVRPRIVAEVVARPWPIHFGSIDFTNSGLTVGTIVGPRSARWGRIEGVRELEDRHQIVVTDRQGKQELLGSMPLVEANAVFLPDILDALKARAEAERRRS